MIPDPENNPNPARSLEELIDAYFDRELPSDQEALLSNLLRQHAGAAMLFSESEAAVEALRAPVESPDFTQSILAEVGHRRGWLGARFQRFVSVGRVALAACLLLALAVTLTARRLAPDALMFPPAPTPVSNIANCAADDTNCSVNEIIAAIDQVGAATRFDEMRQAIPTASFQALKAGFVSGGALNPFAVDTAAIHAAPRTFTFQPATFELTIAVAKNGCLKSLNGQQQVGAVVYIARTAPTERSDEPETIVGGW